MASLPPIWLKSEGDNYPARGGDGGVNTFAYVGGKPTVSIDPYGLVMWTGAYRIGGFAAPVGATIEYFDLESECVSGLKATASVLFIGPAIGLGVEVFGAEGEIAFEMHRDDIAPWEFRGVAGVYSASVMGFGSSHIVLGSARCFSAPSGRSDGAYYRDRSVGIEKSIDVGWFLVLIM